MRTCSKCSCEYPATAEHFVPSRECPDGIGRVCRTCRNAYHRRWKEERREALSVVRRQQYADRYGPIQREKERQRRDAYPIRVRAQLLRSGMRERSKETGCDWDRSVFTVRALMDWLMYCPNCPCCGVLFDAGYKHDGKKRNSSPSIDRFDPHKGYVVGNAALICWRCNNLKRDATIEELETVVAWMKSWGNEI